MPVFFLQRIFLKMVLLTAVVVSLESCAGNSKVLADVVRMAWQQNDKIDLTLAQVLNPAYRYLRVTLDGRPFLMVLGYVDHDPETGEPVEVWYTGQGEVLKLKNARLVGMTGTKSDWLAVRHSSMPSWTDAARMPESGAASYVRTRDLKVAYQFGLQDQVSLKRIPAQPSTAMAGLKPKNLVWLEESYTSRAQLPASQFAVLSDANEGANARGASSSRVVYSWQCLSVEMCFSFQEWTIQDQAAAQLRQGKMEGEP